MQESRRLRQAPCRRSTFAPASGSGPPTQRTRTCSVPSTACYAHEEGVSVRRGVYLLLSVRQRRQEWKRETCFRETCFFVWWCRWQQKGLDPKYYHTEPDGSNWVYSFASQSLLSAGLPAHSTYEAAPWELDPSYLSQGIPSFPSPPLAGPPPPRPGACAHAQRSLGGITSCSAH